MLADGTAITVWSTTTALRATVRPPGAALAARPSRSPLLGDFPVLAAGDRVAVAVWLSRGRLMAAARAPDHEQEDQPCLPPPSSASCSPPLWRPLSTPGAVERGDRGPPIQLSDTVANTDGVQLVGGTDGRVLAVWSYRLGSGVSGVDAVSRRPDGRWGPRRAFGTLLPVSGVPFTPVSGVGSGLGGIAAFGANRWLGLATAIRGNASVHPSRGGRATRLAPHTWAACCRRSRGARAGSPRSPTAPR